MEIVEPEMDLATVFSFGERASKMLPYGCAYPIKKLGSSDGTNVDTTEAMNESGGFAADPDEKSEWKKRGKLPSTKSVS